MPAILASSALLALAAPEARAEAATGPELLVNVTTLGIQRAPAVAADAQGNFVVVWAGETAPPGPGIFARCFDASGRPLGGEIRVDSLGETSWVPPRVAVDADGDFVVVWSAPQPIGFPFTQVYARRFDKTGQPSGPEFRIEEPVVTFGSPDVAMDASGRFVVVWRDRLDPFRERIAMRRFDSAGQPLGGVIAANVVIDGQRWNPRIAMAPTGEFVVTWTDRRNPFPEPWARRFGPDGQPQGGEFKVSEVPPGTGDAAAVPVVYPDGEFSVVWHAVNFQTGASPVSARRFSADGAAKGNAVGLVPVGAEVAAAPGPDGGTLVLWSGTELDIDNGGVHGRLFDASWRPLGDTFLVNTHRSYIQDEAAVVALPGGDFAAVWASGEGFPVILPTGLEGLGSLDGSFFGVFARRLSAGCLPGSRQLCLAGKRFTAEVTWRTPQAEGTGRAFPLTDDTGAFWFFGPDNVELTLKVLDGRTVNGHFWLYYASLTDVEFDLTLVDTLTGVRKSYHNPRSRRASQADVAAFPDTAPAGLRVISANASGQEPGTLQDAAAPASAGERCRPVDPGLCLKDRRFAVEAAWRDPASGAWNAAQAVGLTEDTGAFWFFGEENLELVVKVLDGKGVNGHFWVFYGSLTDVEFELTVLDTVTGERQTYENPPGRMASGSDTGSFRWTG